MSLSYYSYVTSQGTQSISTVALYHHLVPYARLPGTSLPRISISVHQSTGQHHRRPVPSDTLPVVPQLCSEFQSLIFKYFRIYLSKLFHCRIYLARFFQLFKLFSTSEFHLLLSLLLVALQYVQYFFYFRESPIFLASLGLGLITPFQILAAKHVFLNMSLIALCNHFSFQLLICTRCEIVIDIIHQSFRLDDLILGIYLDINVLQF